MAALYGGIQGNRGEATRLSHDILHTWAQTWNVKVDVQLWKDGTYRVYVRDIHSGTGIDSLEGQYPKAEVPA